MTCLCIKNDQWCGGGVFLKKCEFPLKRKRRDKRNLAVFSSKNLTQSLRTGGSKLVALRRVGPHKKDSDLGSSTSRVGPGFNPSILIHGHRPSAWIKSNSELHSLNKNEKKGASEFACRRRMSFII